MKKIAGIFILMLVLLTSAVYGADLYKVIKEKCVGCKICIKECPVKAIKMVGNKAIIDATKCVGCGLCVGKCPVKAIVKDEPVKK